MLNDHALCWAVTLAVIKVTMRCPAAGGLCCLVAHAHDDCQDRHYGNRLMLGHLSIAIRTYNRHPVACCFPSRLVKCVARMVCLFCCSCGWSDQTWLALDRMVSALRMRLLALMYAVIADALNAADAPNPVALCHLPCTLSEHAVFIPQAPRRAWTVLYDMVPFFAWLPVMVANYLHSVTIERGLASCYACLCGIITVCDPAKALQRHSWLQE